MDLCNLDVVKKSIVIISKLIKWHTLNMYSILKSYLNKEVFPNVLVHLASIIEKSSTSKMY